MFVPCKQVFILIINLFLCLDDNNRVVLSNIPDVEHSDYINASYIDVSQHFLLNGHIHM